MSEPKLEKQVWVASVGILLFLTLVKHLGALVPAIGGHAFTAAAAVQLYVPLMLIGKYGIEKETLGLTLDNLKQSTHLAFLFCVLTVIPFALGHHLWQTVLFHKVWAPRLPPDFLESVLTQIAVVALPEELFFRGYLQERMTRLWPEAKLRIFGVPFGRAIVLSALVFALGHFLGEYRLDRLGPFFPALAFGFLRARTGSIVAPVAYHAFCNLLSEVLFTCYRPG